MMKFERSNRRLEQFFFAHDVRFISFYRGRDGLTVWVYELDEEEQRVLEEYRALQARWIQHRTKEENIDNAR